MQYAYFDSTVAAPSPVIGWIDTEFLPLANMPVAADLLELTEAQWSERMSGQWAVSAGALVAYTPPAVTPSLAQQAQAALASGLAITSTATTALNGTYSTDAITQQHVMAEVASLMLNSTFADGGSTVAWPDVAGSLHTFTAAQFKTLATAISAYVAALLKCASGQLTALPAATATIP